MSIYYKISFWSFFVKKIITCVLRLTQLNNFNHMYNIYGTFLYIYDLHRNLSVYLRSTKYTGPSFININIGYIRKNLSVHLQSTKYTGPSFILILIYYIYGKTFCTFVTYKIYRTFLCINIGYSLIIIVYINIY